jgi:hypothetical protein
MDERTSQRAPRAIDSGDRVHIRQGSKALRPELLGRAGTVVEVFRVPRDSCLVRMDGDLNRQREWFFYRDELTTNDPRDQAHLKQEAIL